MRVSASGPASEVPVAPLSLGGLGLQSRISIVYAAIYLHYGAFGLFIPMWFDHRGLSAEQIGVLMSLPLILRVFFVAPVTGLADRIRRIREVLLVCIVVAMLLIATMGFAHTYVQMLCFFTVFALVWDPLPILGDSYAVLAVRTRKVDFGQMRMWGSIGFIAANLASGALIERYSPEVIPYFTAALLAVPIIPILFLPPDRLLGEAGPKESADWKQVLLNRNVLLAMLATALVTASHTLVITFGAIQWTAAGMSGTSIGILVGIAAVSEIAVLFVVQRLLGKRSPLWLIALGAAFAVVRWVCMSFEPGFAGLAVLQLTNGLSGMGCITGLMLFIAREIDGRFISTAQGVNAVILGVVAALATSISGYTWSSFGYDAYLLSAAVALAGGVLTVVILRGQTKW